MEHSSSEIHEEIPETNAPPEQTEVPRGWQPSADTVANISGGSETPHTSDWVDRGIQDVPVDKIDMSDSQIKSADDFHKVSHDEMVEGFRKLETTVRPAVEQGADGDYFHQMDQAQDLDYEHGYERVYDAFYGDQAICLNQDGNHITVESGYHRLEVARELGVKTVPARVIERR